MVDAYLGDKEDGEITEDEDMPPLIPYQEDESMPTLKVALPPNIWPSIPSSPIKYTLDDLVDEAQQRLQILAAPKDIKQAEMQRMEQMRKDREQQRILDEAAAAAGAAAPRERFGLNWPTSPITENFVDDGGMARSGHFVL
jgi:hypothetical protein